MEKEKKYFLAEDSQLNADDAAFAVSPNSWVNGENFRTKSTDKGVTGTVESIGGTLLISQPQPSVTHIVIGSVNDAENSRICYFKYCTTVPADKIVCYDKRTNQEFDVLLDSQVEGGLNFSKDKCIHSARVVDGMIVLTDDFNEPRYINIDAGIKLNNPTFVTDQEPYAVPVKLTLVKKPPLYRLMAEKVADGAFLNNYTQNNAYQIAYQYQFKDYQLSVLSTYSALMPFNYTEEVNNAISITVNYSEHIDDYVQDVIFWVKNLVTDKIYQAKRYSKLDPVQAQIIQDHNDGIANIQFLFYDNEAAVFLDDISSVTSEDDVPLLSKTLEVVNNRVHFGNNLTGYDTPIKTSLETTVIETDTDSGEFDAEWGYITLHANWQAPGGCQDVYNYPFLYSVTAPHQFYYFPSVRVNTAWNGGTNPADLTLTQNIIDATIVNDTELAFVNNLKFFVTPASVSCTTTFPTWQTAYEITYSFSPPKLATLLAFVPGVQGFFKSASTYLTTISFYDKFRRKCGVVNKRIESNIPERVYSQTVFSAAIQWTLSNLDAVNEIPDWAYWYQIHITKNLTTRFFLQARTLGADYVNKNQDGTYSYGHSTITVGVTYAIGIDISSLQYIGFGYSFTEGDYVRIGLNDDTNKTIPIIAQDGNFILCQPINLGVTLDTTTILLVEIYTPYKIAQTEFFYETGEIYPINDPTTVNRTYSTLTDILNGDAYAIERDFDISTQYITENMSPNDKQWKLWFTDTGWPNTVDTIGQQRLKEEIRFSDVAITGTKVNGLNKFQPLNNKTLDVSDGPISKLQITNKIQMDGTVMLAICENETISCYLGEQEVFDTQGSAFVAQANNVIGSTKSLRGSRGTVNPETVVEYMGNVFWGDAKNGRWVQYSVNGLFDISSYKMVRFWKQFFLQYNSMSSAQIESLGARPFIFSTVDPSHDELLISIPKLLTDPPKGYLPDYPNEIFPFDIWDGRGKTIVYKLASGAGQPYWMNAFKFNPEWLTYFENNLYAWKNGQMYLHNQTLNPNEFYGVKYSSKIMVVSNALPNKPKLYNNVSSESNLVPSFVYFYNNQPLQQSSDLVDNDFRQIEGGWFTTVKRNKLLPTPQGYTTDGLLTGEKMRNDAMWIMFEWRIEKTPLELRFLNVGYSVSLGYNI